MCGRLFVSQKSFYKLWTFYDLPFLKHKTGQDRPSDERVTRHVDATMRTTSYKLNAEILGWSGNDRWSETKTTQDGVDVDIICCLTELDHLHRWVIDKKSTSNTRRGSWAVSSQLTAVRTNDCLPIAGGVADTVHLSSAPGTSVIITTVTDNWYNRRGHTPPAIHCVVLQARDTRQSLNAFPYKPAS